MNQFNEAFNAWSFSVDREAAVNALRDKYERDGIKYTKNSLYESVDSYKRERLEAEIYQN